MISLPGAGGRGGRRGIGDRRRSRPSDAVGRGIVQRLPADRCRRGHRRRGRAGVARRRGRRWASAVVKPGCAAALDRSNLGAAGGALPPSSSVIAILKVPSTMTTTLAPTSSERILEVIVEASLAVLGLADGGSLAGPRAALSPAARRGGGLGGATGGGDEVRCAGRLARRWPEFR